VSRERTTVGIAFAWGLAEATFLFVVPDILLSLVAMRRPRLALAGVVAALVGALAGGAAMHAFGHAAPERARAFLDRVPGISPDLIEGVRAQLREHGPVALLLGAVGGRPYKIFAVESGAASSGLGSFLAASTVARALRFLASVLLARLCALGLARWTRLGTKLDVKLRGSFWLAFSVYYFASFGW